MLLAEETFNRALIKPVIETVIAGNGEITAYYQEYYREIGKKEDGCFELSELWWLLTPKALIRLEITPFAVATECYYRNYITRVGHRYELISDNGIWRNKLRQIEVYLLQFSNPVQLHRPKDNAYNERFMEMARLISGC